MRGEVMMYMRHSNWIIVKSGSGFVAVRFSEHTASE